MENLYTLMNELNQRGAFLTVCGPISFDLIIGISGTIKEKMKQEAVKSSTILKVFSVFVENAENVIRYSSDRLTLEDEKEIGQGILMVGHSDQKHFVICGNLIENDNIDRLRGNLSLIQKMSKPELKEYYRKKRKEGPDEGSKGASLGFLEIAKKSSEPIEFNFKQLNDTHSFFYLKTVI